MSLFKDSENTYFPNVYIRTEGGVLMGRLIIRTSSAALVFDPLRRLTQLPTAKIIELKYLLHQ